MSKELEYTKGEWQIAGRNADGYSIKQVGCSCKIAQVIKDPLYVNQDTALANAQLIAASPELYEACKLALDYIVEYDTQNKVISGLSFQLNKALAKAEGWP